MAYQLDRKLKDLEFERKQVLHHLALLDANIATIQKAIALMQTTPKTLSIAAVSAYSKGKSANT